jgi:hypothetical protein
MASISGMFKRKKTADQIVVSLAKHLREISEHGVAEKKVRFPVHLH